MRKEFETLDIWLASYLSLCGIHPILENKNNRVVFIFPQSDDLYRLISNFNSNISVPVADFTTIVKMLRSQMIQLRGQR